MWSFFETVFPSSSTLETDKGPAPHIIACGDVDDTAVQTVSDAWAELPLPLKDFLVESDNKIFVAKTLSVALPSGDAFKQVSDGDPRIHYDQVQGACADNEVYLAQLYYKDRVRVEVTPFNASAPDLDAEQARYHQEALQATEEKCPGLVSHDFSNPAWHEVSPARMNNVFDHEIGHVVYHRDIFNDPSYKNAFDNAYDNDLAFLGGSEFASLLGLGYYVQGDGQDRGRNEAFAEASMVHLDGAGANLWFSLLMPKTCAWTKEYYENFEQHRLSFVAEADHADRHIGGASPAHFADLADLSALAHVADQAGVSSLTHLADQALHACECPSLKLTLSACVAVMAHVKYREGYVGTNYQYVSDLGRKAAKRVEGLFSSAKEIVRSVEARRNNRIPRTAPCKQTL